MFCDPYVVSVLCPPVGTYLVTPSVFQERVYYLRTLDLVLTNTDYQDHMHYNNQIFDLLRKVWSVNGQ